MNNVIIHAPDGNEYNTNAYAYYADRNQLKFRDPITSNWLVFDNVDVTIDVAGFLIEISCTYRH